MNLFNKIKIYLSILILILFCTPKLIHAANNNFLNVKIEEHKNDLIITENWNVVTNEDGYFEREFALDKSSISNISINEKFPQFRALSYSAEYNDSKKCTTIKVKTNSELGKTIAINLEYKLSLDTKTKTDFINNLPHSLTTSNPYKIDKINLDLNTNEYNYNEKIDFQMNNTFIQRASKSKIVEVFIQLFKLSINTLVIGVICFILYTVGISMYYKILNNKRKRKEPKKIKTTKKVFVTRKKNLLKTRIY